MYDPKVIYIFPNLVFKILFKIKIHFSLNVACALWDPNNTYKNI